MLVARYGRVDRGLGLPPAGLGCILALCNACGRALLMKLLDLSHETDKAGLQN